MRQNFKRNVQCLATALLLVCAVATARAQGTAGYSEYYLPGDELNMYYIFDDLDDNATGNTGMHSVTSVVAWSASTTVYYDHWENGYNFDPANPGSTADETVALPNQGSIQTFESSNVPSGGPPPAVRNPATTCAGQVNPGNRCYDGGDRLYIAGGPVTVTRAVWMEARGAGNQGDAWEVYPVQPQLTTYILPFGENNYAASTTFFTGFERVFALVQATAPNTVVSVDLDANGTADMLNLNRDAVRGNAGDATSVTLQTGQTFLLDRISACSAGANCTTFPGGGTLNSGAVITGNETLQVKFVAGRMGTTYAARGLSAFPRGFWTEDYYAPLGEAAAAGRNTDYYLFNPHATPLTINWQSQNGAGSFVVPANSTESYNRALGANPSVPVAQGLYFSASQPFWGVGFGDSTGQAFEWGFSLLPTSFLYDEHFLGWSPGSLPLGSAPTNGNSVFLTVAQDNTVVFVDYTNDGIADATRTLNRLEQWFVPPSPAGDLAGARFWATGQFSMAWGENADTATTPTPNLDLGYVALPGTDFISLALTVDKTANPSVVPAAAGSTTQFRLSTKSKAYTMSSVNVVDTLPPNWQYSNNTTTITRPDLTTLTGAAANPTITGAGTAVNPFVLTWSAAQTGGNMGANQEILITFTAATTVAFPVGTLSQNRVRSTGSRTVGTPGVTQTFVATDFAYVVTGNVQITKTSNATTPLYPGDTFTYTVTVTNPAAAGTNLLTGVSLYDVLPAGLTGVAGTTSLSRSSVADNFNTNSYALNAGTRNWAGNWVEANDAAGAGAGAGDFVVAGGELRLDNAGSNEPTLSRAVSTTGATANNVRLSFRYRTDTGVDAGDGMLVLAGNAGTGGAFGTTLATITGIAGASTATVSFNIPTGLIGANTAIRFQPVANTYTGGTENFFVDDLSITYNVAVTGPNPPDLLSTTALYALVGGQSMTATFNVTVENPFPNASPTLTNTAATTSVQIPLQLTASATNTVTTPTITSASVAGRVWIDANANGAQDVGEGGIDNVIVTLKDQFGTPIATTVTDSNGRYLFSGVTPGNGYYVEATAPPNPGSYPAGLTQSFPLGFSNDRSAAFDLSAGENYTQANLGYRATDTTAIFGDFAWIDTDADQVRDAGEVGIIGVTLTLYRDANGNGVLEPGTDTLVTTATTTPDGSYLITGITPSPAGTDTYFVAAATPAGYTATTPTSVRFTNVQQGGSYVSADFGYLPSGASFTITDRVWHDANGNGLFAVGEAGIAGVTIELLDATANVIGTTTTAADGTFAFSGLTGSGADYTTRITDVGNVLADYYGTTAFAIARQRLESNVNANVNRAAAPSYGFNFTRTIGDTVYNDLNGNGTQDAGEPGFAGVTVSLYRDVNGNGVINAGDTIVGTVTTDANGQYFFTGVTNGTYIVSVPAQTGYNYIAGGRTDTDGVTAGIQLAANVVGGANVLTRDYGFQAVTPRSISGKVWNDTNQNGGVNAGEAGVAGVTVEVLSVVAGAGTISTTGGSNTITGTGTNFTVLNPGDPILINGVAYVVQNVTSDTSLTLTKLYTGPTASGLAWSRPSAVLLTTTTNATGDYTFSGLSSATHIVRVTDQQARLTGYGSTFEITEGLVTAGNPANFVEPVNVTAGNAANVNFGYIQLGLAPTLIELRTFEAEQHGKKVNLRWETAFETNNLGFNIYRLLGGKRTKVNKSIIAGSAFVARRNAPAAGYSYRFRDRLASEDAFVQYFLEDVDTAGERTLHGPFTPMMNATEPLDEEDSVSLAGLGADGSVIANAAGVGVVRPSVLGTPTANQTARQLEIAAETALKVYVAREGWYRITQAQMAAAGFDGQPDTVSVWCQGVEQPVVVNDDSIEFYALDLDTPATGARTYWVRNKDNDVTLEPAFSGGGTPLTGSVPFVYQRIDRSVWVPNFLDTADGENFFGPIVTSTPVSQDLSVGGYDASAASPAKLQLTIRGGSEDIEHRIRVELNGFLVSTAVLDNLDAKTFAWDVPHAWLGTGANTLTLTALNGDVDVSVLVSARLTYQHLLRADDGLFEAELPASRQVTITGFPDDAIRALDITDPLAPKALEVTVEPDGASHSATFTTLAAGGPRTVMVFSSNRISTEAELELSAPSSWAVSRRRLRADMVILTHRNFAAAAESLASVRTAEGVTTVVVDVDDVYDEYNFGVRSPASIRAFLKEAQTWLKAPIYVLLMGDASIDPRGYLELGLVDYVPTQLVPTVYLKTAADGWFADFDNNGIEELAIGRLPVQTEAQAAVVVDKIASRGIPFGSWANKAVMIADVPDIWNFEGSIGALSGLLPPAVSPTTINIASTPSPRDTVLSAMNAGSVFVDYVGHGSVGLWNHNVLTDADAASLQNADRLPFVAAMTCLNAYFHDLFATSLAEALLLAPNGGAVAVWSSSSLTEPGPQVVMNQELLRHIFGSITVGQAIIKAKQATPDPDVRRSWNLLGDPSMRLK
jgi:uncharacterized repeat protein (TIGR01451 family)